MRNRLRAKYLKWAPFVKDMTQTTALHKIHEDLELLKMDMAEIKEMISLQPELREEVITQVKEARKRISKGQFIRNKDVLKEFGLE